MAETTKTGAADPLHGFNFLVEFHESATGPRSIQDNSTMSSKDREAPAPGKPQNICEGAFSEISGLEATVEPFAINEGGRNWGQIQRVGRTTFATVILRRGLTRSRHLWTWFQAIHGGGKYRHRLDVTITLKNHNGDGEVEWTLTRAMPVKMKLADLNAAGQEVAIEELHLVHEGLSEKLLKAPKRPIDGTPARTT